MIQLLNLILKQWTRAKQKAWAEHQAERIAPMLPLGAYCKAAGWWPGCEPLTEWRELEWVEVWIDAGPGSTIARRLTYPDNPTPGQVSSIVEELAEASFA